LQICDFRFYSSDVRIIDEEIDLKKIKAGYEVDEDELETQEDAPYVAAAIDERSEELRAKQHFLESSKWKRLNDTELEKETLGFKSINPSANKKDSQLLKSDAAMKKKNLDSSSQKRHHGSDSDKSLPRRRQDSDSDRSPPHRRYDSDTDAIPPRLKRATCNTAQKYSDLNSIPHFISTQKGQGW
jgi:pre-mRNA-splicing factor CWC26